MKKQRGKLSINRQTVRTLRGDELRGAAGAGNPWSRMISFCWSDCLTHWNTCPTNDLTCGGCTIA